MSGLLIELRTPLPVFRVLNHQVQSSSLLENFQLYVVRLYNVDLLTRHLSEYGFEVECVRGVALAPNKLLRREIAHSLLERAANTLAHLCSNVIVIALKAKAA